MVFIDTNVLVSAVNRSDLLHDRARAILDLSLGAERCYVSNQTLREFFSASTRPVSANGLGLAPDEAVAAIEILIPQVTVLDDTHTVRSWLLRLVGLHQVKGEQIHDANIVATMLAHGVRRLMTFNSADFERYANQIELVAP
jgi:predicted nucleic acid-binding protein